jgi:hypothetical protein
LKLPEKYDPDFPYPLVADGSEPLPDPSWDYASVYGRAIAIRREVEMLLAEIGEVENATRESDQAVRDRFRQIVAQVNAAMSDLD